MIKKVRCFRWNLWVHTFVFFFLCIWRGDCFLSCFLKMLNCFGIFSIQHSRKIETIGAYTHTCTHTGEWGLVWIFCQSIKSIHTLIHVITVQANKLLVHSIKCYKITSHMIEFEHNLTTPIGKRIGKEAK